MAFNLDSKHIQFPVCGQEDQHNRLLTDSDFVDHCENNQQATVNSQPDTMKVDFQNEIEL